MPRLSCTEATFRLEAIRSEMDAFRDEIAEYAKTGDKSLELGIKNKGLGIERMVKELKEELSGKASLEQAKEIFGKDFLGPEAIQKTWGIRLEAKDIPPIPFHTEDLERAKELGQFLILRASLTMQKMEELHQDKTFQNDWFKQEDFYTKETSKPGWALVSKEPIPDSTSKNYIEQTQTICDYLDSEVFGKSDEMPEVYEDAIIEFDAKKKDLENLLQSDWKECVKQLSELQITKLTRPSVADVMHDLLVYKQNNDERLLENIYTWTSARGSGGGLVDVGGFGSGGVGVSNWKPGLAYDRLGASFVRSS